jgi:hypothetical protein
VQHDEALDLIYDLRHAVLEFKVLPLVLDRLDESPTDVSGTWPPGESASVLAAWFAQGWLELRRPIGLDRKDSGEAGPPEEWEVLTPTEGRQVLANPETWRKPPFDIIRLATAASAPVDPNTWFSEAICASGVIV